MDTKDILTVIAVILSVLIYIPLVKHILGGKLEQSFATWILWVALDVIAYTSILLTGGKPFQVLIIYITGGGVVVASLVYTRQFTWTWFETFVLMLVLTSLSFWVIFGARAAIISSSIAVAISGLPQLKDSWKKPDRETMVMYTGWLIVNTLFLFAGKEWTIQDRFYPACCIPICAAIALVASRKHQPVAKKSWQRNRVWNGV